VTLESEGLLGQRFLDITRGSPQSPSLSAGGEVKYRSRPDLGDVVASSATVMTNLNRVITSVNRTMAQVESGKGTIGKLIYDESLYERADATVREAQKLVASAASGQGSLGKLLVSDEIYSAFGYDQPFASPAEFNEDVLVLDGFSKAYGMTGWRLLNGLQAFLADFNKSVDLLAVDAGHEVRIVTNLVIF